MFNDHGKLWVEARRLSHLQRVARHSLFMFTPSSGNFDVFDIGYAPNLSLEGKTPPVLFVAHES